MIYLIDDNIEFCKNFALSMDKVKIFHQANQALVEAVEENPEIIITDINLPPDLKAIPGYPHGLNGVELANIFVQMNPKRPVIAISGNSLKETTDQYGTLNPGVTYFQKPLSDSFFQYLESLFMLVNIRILPHEAECLLKIHRDVVTALRVLIAKASNDI